MAKFRFTAAALAVFAAGFVAGQMFDGGRAEAQAKGGKVFELRTYTSPDGRLNDLVARFRDDTMRIFKKHGMQNVGYFVPADAPASSNTLVYILAHDSRDAATKSWAAFRDDRMESRHGADPSQRPDRLERGVRVPRADGLLAIEVDGWPFQPEGFLALATLEGFNLVSALPALRRRRVLLVSLTRRTRPRMRALRRAQPLAHAEGWRDVARGSKPVARHGCGHRHSGAQILFVEKGRARAQEPAARCASSQPAGLSTRAPTSRQLARSATPDSEFTQSRADRDGGRRPTPCGVTKQVRRRAIQRNADFDTKWPTLIAHWAVCTLCRSGTACGQTAKSIVRPSEARDAAFCFPPVHGDEPIRMLY
jgi:hypothetical protein